MFSGEVDVPMDMWTIVVNIVTMTLAALLTALYILVFVVVVFGRREVFKNSFYTIFKATAVMDIIAGVCLVFSTLRLFAFFDGISFYWDILGYGLNGVASFTHLFGNFYVALNRFSAVVYPTSYRNVWSSYRLLGLIAFQYAVSIASRLIILRADPILKMSDSGVLVFRSFTPEITLILRYVTLGTLIPYFVFSGLMNSKIVFTLNTTSASQSCRYMTKYSAITFMCCQPFVAYQFAEALSVILESDILMFVVQHLRGLVLLFFYFSNPIWLLIMSRDVRQVLTCRSLRITNVSSYTQRDGGTTTRKESTIK